jgi:hypothetical protein
MCACGCVPNRLTSGEAFCELDHTAYILLLRCGDRRRFNLSRFFGIERGWRTASHLVCALIRELPRQLTCTMRNSIKSKQKSVVSFASRNLS